MSLRAILSGVAVALIAQIVLLILGAAIGLSVFQAQTGDADVAQGIGVGAVIWLLLSLTASAFAGAWISVVVSRTSLTRDGILSGVVTWATVSLFGLFLVTSVLAGSVSKLLGAAGETAQVAAPVVREQAPGIEPSLGARAEEAQRALPETEQAAEGAALGFWALFLAHLIPFGAAILGGAAGAHSERRRLVPPPAETTTGIVEPPTIPQPT